MSDQLRALGIDLIEGFGAEQLALAPDLFVIGNVVSRGNPLMEAILDAGAPTPAARSGWREHVLQGRHVLAVAGTHGKTTTTRCWPGSWSRPGCSRASWSAACR
jgi:UDP-N-acetylmuramate: L-alanyl-gamma-D-glutamyl-meso-diaminopimelate ligase